MLCFTGKMQLEGALTTKSPPEKTLQGLSGMRAPLWRPQVPSNEEKFLRKVPPMTTVGRPPWVKWRPPSPPPFRDFQNALLTKALYM